LNAVFFIILRRMRTPLVVLIVAYAIAIGGLVLIPGSDAEGRPWRFDFFHAFYFVSYTASTIGFGEIPYAFSPAQRMWVSFSIYLTVLGWLYAIGAILALVQDPAFRRSIADQRFERKVARLTEPFYIVCGFGETGERTARMLLRLKYRVVAIDRDPERIAALELFDWGVDLPALCADYRDPGRLLLAGLDHPGCRGLVTVSNDDEANVEAALAARLLNPRLRVVCRTQSDAARAKLPSLSVDEIVDAFQTFAEQLALALNKPSAHALYEALGSLPGEPLPDLLEPPRGTWLICGYGRFGSTVARNLAAEGVAVRIIEPDARTAPPGAFIGLGTSREALEAAGCREAVGIIAGSDSDTGNLAIALTAREANQRVFIVARQNNDHNHALFAQAPVDFVVQTSRMLVNRIFADLTNPLLRRFLEHVRAQSEAWSAELHERLAWLCRGHTPETWTLELGTLEAPAVAAALAAGRDIRLRHLLCEPQARDERLPCVPLALLRAGAASFLPAEDLRLELGDSVLFAARPGVAARMEWVLGAANVLEYVESGAEFPDAWLFRWLAARRRRARG
jgi:Trk K+ transport system NAD-binding subunit